jgi:hypothetical protein
VTYYNVPEVDQPVLCASQLGTEEHTAYNLLWETPLFDKADLEENIHVFHEHGLVSIMAEPPEWTAIMFEYTRSVYQKEKDGKIELVKKGTFSAIMKNEES